MSTVAIIPARGGSQRIPLKNIKTFHGQPIIAYSIQAAQQSKLFDHIVVSTDDVKIADVAIEYGAKIHRRDPILADHLTGTQEVMQAVLKDMATAGDHFARACCIYPCAPMLHPGMLVRAELALLEPAVQYVVPVGTWLQDPGMFYFGQAKAFLNRYPLIGLLTRIIDVDPARCCDINTPEDFSRAETMYAALQERLETI